MGPPESISRRSALRMFSAAVAALAAFPGIAAAATDELPVAVIGRTGRTLPRLGLGCYPLCTLAKEEDAVALLRRAFDLGVRYLDTAPSYGNGKSETRVGLALRSWLKDNPGVTRADFYVATKTLRRDEAGARRELEESLKRLDLEYVDSIQCHEVHDDWESLFAADGVLRALEKARAEKLLRFTGITCHRDPQWIINSVRRLPPREDGTGFVTALVPVNPVDVQHRSFVREFLPIAKELGVAVIAMKIFGGGFLLSENGEDGARLYSAADLLRYALAQPAVAIAVPGCEQAEHVEQGHAALVPWSEPTASWLAEVEARAPRHKGKSTEWYKDEKPKAP